MVLSNKYVLITPVRNEENCIENTIQSVLCQTHLPSQWVIVDDGSTDKTVDIIRKYEKMYPFLSVVSVENENGSNFASKAMALKAGYEKLTVKDYDFIGNLDGDVTFDENYFLQLIEQFQTHEKLGIAGGVIVELINGRFIMQKINENSVAGAVQLFRRKCFDNIDGYIPIKTGGIDAAAEIMAKMSGWDVLTFKDLLVHHHRPVGFTGKSAFKARFSQGIKDYCLGYHPLFYLVFCMKKILQRPIFCSPFIRFAGYCWAFINGLPIALSREAVVFLRKDQIERLKKSIKFNFSK